MKYLENTRSKLCNLPVLFLFCLPIHAAAQSNNLFQFLPEPQARQSQTMALRGKATYPIRVDKNTSALGIGDQLSMPLPGGGFLQLTVDKKWITPNGDVQLVGQFEGDGSAVMTFGRDSFFANLSNQEHNYGVGLDQNGQSFLIDHKASGDQVDLGDDMRFPEDMPIDSASHSSEQLSIANASADDKSVITLLAVYSPQFASGFANPVTRINQMIAFTNQAYERSGIYIELQLAHAQQIAFNNGANIGTLLDQATDGTGDFSSLHALRNQYFADMVAVLPFSTSGSVSGVAWVNGNRQRLAYSVSQFAVWGSDSVFAHELGHNLGSGHERRSANPAQRSPCSGGYTGYACGHGNGSEGTIMSYLNDADWNYVFSNPALDCNEEPCGIAQGQTNAADNRSSFNITAPLIEAFRIDTTNDDDRDGVRNNVDNCPNNYNPGQTDTDSDNLGDVCDSDDDNDGISDGLDNCPLISNPLQEDSDDNGIGDACQSDEICFPVRVGRNKASLICL